MLFLIFQFVNVVYHIDWFLYIEESLHPWNKPSWSWCMSFFMCCWILFAKILLRIFASMYISDIGQKFSFFVLSLVLVSGWSWPHRISLEVLLPLQFFERVLIGQPLYCSTVDAGMRGERGYGDGFTPYAWLSSITLFPWLPGFPPQAFPTRISSLTSPGPIFPQSTAALALGLLHNP